MDESRTDEYASRMTEVKEALEQKGWTKVREDEWRKDSESVRFSYAHREFRIFVRRHPAQSVEEQHSIHVREDAHVPTVKEIVEDILELAVGVARTTPVW